MKSESSKPVRPSGMKTGISKLLVVFLLAFLIAPMFVYADNPSPNTWAFGGGGFCEGTYTMFNSTDNHIYAQNCATGANDYTSATDSAAVFNSIMTGGNCNNGCEVDYRVGVFALQTPMILGRNSVHIKGSVSGGDAAYYGSVSLPDGRLNGTFLVAKSVMTNMISFVTSPVYSASTGGTQSFMHINIENLQLWANCKATNGINLSGNEVSSYEIIRNVMFGVRINLGNSGGTCGFSGTALIMDGQEDSIVEDSAFAGALDTGRGGAPVDTEWQVAGGNGIFINDLFGGAVSIAIAGQQFAVTDGTINSVKLLGLVQMLAITNAYMANYVTGQTPTSRINLNGFNLETLNLLGDFILLNGSGGPSMSWIGGTGTVFNQGWSGDNFQTSGGSPNWNPGGATLTKQVTDGDNHAHNLSNCAAGACFTNFPFTIDVNGNF